MASIRFRTNKWQCRIQRQGFPALSKAFETKEDAQRWARGIERSMDLGEYEVAETTTTTLTDLIDRYLKEVTPTKRGAFQEKYRLGVIKADKVATMNIKTITSADVAAFRDRRLTTVKPITARHDLCAMSAVFEHARLEWSYPITNPVRGIRKPSIGQGRDRRLNGNEEERLLVTFQNCRSSWIKPLFQFSIETACRRSEALKLKWADVDLGKRIAVLRGTKNGDNRVIPLSGKAVQVLSALPRDLKGNVFPVPMPTVRSAFEHACKRAEIENLRWHDLRHEAVSRLHERGLSTVEVAAISGHKTLACLARYSHMKVERLAEKLA
ncbi:site-specific integrase [Dechloromonas denitrificans]|uniref:integrase n=1 Tax=Dechloromonas denitrificans TaxID=281362 RepID=UPI001CF91D31|nr:site-specific integrase [Dechloromonas denitrificans]UCV10821.1 site-specific integrase [Dechloromonas denitrificans]